MQRSATGTSVGAQGQGSMGVRNRVRRDVSLVQRADVTPRTQFAEATLRPFTPILTFPHQGGRNQTPWPLLPHVRSNSDSLLVQSIPSSAGSESFGGKCGPKRPTCPDTPLNPTPYVGCLTAQNGPSAVHSGPEPRIATHFGLSERSSPSTGVVVALALLCPPETAYGVVGCWVRGRCHTLLGSPHSARERCA